MTDYYLDSSATGLNNGTSKTDAWTSIASATGLTVSDKLLASHTHSELSVTTLAFTTTGDGLVECISVNFATDAYTAGASIASTASNMTVTGFVRFKGFSVLPDYTLSHNENCHVIYDACALANTDTTASNRSISVGVGTNFIRACLVEIINCTYTVYRADLRSISAGRMGKIIIRGLTINYAGVYADTIIKQGSGGEMDASGIDFTGLGMTTGYVIDASTSATVAKLNINNCILSSGVELIDVTNFANTDVDNYPSIEAHSIDDSTGNSLLRIAEANRYGIVVDETTLVRTGGASDGTTSYSHLISTTAYAKPYSAPFRYRVATGNIDLSTSKTISIELLHDSITDLNNDEVWLEICYPDDTTTVHHFENDSMASILDTPVAQASSSESWTTTGMTNPNTQKVSVTTSNTGRLGVVEAYLCVAKASYSLYACPKIVVF